MAPHTTDLPASGYETVSKRVARAPRRILIVRPSALGDVSRTVPALVTLRTAYPDARIDWLVAEPFADVIRHHPMLDGVVLFPRRQLKRFGLSPVATRRGLAFAGQLRHAEYDAVYDFQGLFRSGLFTRLTGSKRRVGFADARELGWLGYNMRHRVGEIPHTVDRMLALLRADGLAVNPDMRLYVGDEDRRWRQRFYEAHGVTPGRTVCLAPTARWLCKCWPIERYIALARRLLERLSAGDKIILLAAPSERAQVQPLVDALPAKMCLYPTTTVGQMMALLSDARLLICNDSAPLHIAVGFGRPIVTIFGPTAPAVVGPYRRENAVISPPGGPSARHYRRHDDQSLIAQVGLDEVWQKVEEVLPR